MLDLLCQFSGQLFIGGSQGELGLGGDHVGNGLGLVILLRTARTSGMHSTHVMPRKKKQIPARSRHLQKR